MKKTQFKLRSLVVGCLGFFRSHPFTTSLLLGLLYLVLFQAPFMSTGDAWAESWYEYIHGAFVSGWNGFFQVGIAGYFNFLPKLLSFPYVLLHLPLQYIDYFFRYAVVAFVVICMAFVAHPYNRPFIKSDFLRVTLALGLLICFNHITSFSMINAWYAGFIPIILISLSPNKFKNEFSMIIYALFSLAVCLTKPSIILLPLVLYRALRHKEYLLGFIISLGIALQTLLLLSSNYLANFPPITTSILSRVANTLLYPGLLLLKSFGAAPSSLLGVILASLLIGLLIYFLTKKIGVVAAGLLLLVILGASYTSLYAPDQPAPSVINHYAILFDDYSKLQREIVVRLLLLFTLFINLAMSYEHWRKKKPYRLIILVIGCALVAFTYRQIDVSSASLVSNLAPFRQEMRQRTIDCIPIAPNALWGVSDHSTPVYPWYFELHDYATCGRTNYAKTFYRSSFYTRVSSTQPISINLDKPYSLTALSLPVRLLSKDSVTTLTLTDTDSGKQFTATVEKRQFDAMANPVFNLTDADKKMHHRYTLTSTNPDVFTGLFDDNTLLSFTYYSLLK